MNNRSIGRWKYSAYVLGVKKRCRNVDRHQSPTLSDNKFVEIKDCIASLDKEQCKLLAKQWAEANFKRIDKVQAAATYHVSDESGLIETWEPFNELHNYRETIELVGAK